MATLLKQVGLGASDPTTLGANTANSNLAGTAFSIRCVAVANGVVDAIRIRCGPSSASGTKTVAIYADNSGQISSATRLGGPYAATFSANAVISIPVSPGLAVTSGTFYWLDFLSTGAVWDYTDYDNDPGAGTTRDTTGQTTNPAPHATTSSSYTNIFNAWAEGTAGGITTLGLTGFEHGFIGAAASAGGGLFDAAPGTGWTASTTSPRNGSYCAHLVAPANTATRLLNNITGSPTKVVVRFAVKVSARPSSAVSEVACLSGASVAIWSLQVTSAGVLQASAGTGAFTTGPTIDTTSWHLIEMQSDSAAGTVDWEVDGVLQTRPATSAQAAATQIWLGVAAATRPAFTADYDDVIIGTWTVAGTDWYGDGKVIAQQAGVDGTHATITSLSPGDAGTAYSGTPTTVNTMVDDPPGTLGWTATRSTTDNIALRTATVGAYAEIKPAVTAETGSANAVKAILSYSSSTATANLAACDVRNSGGAVSELWGLTGGVGKAYNVTANNFKSAIVTRPAAGWTAAEVNAIRMRFGGCTSADISPVPTVQALMLEVDWPVTTITSPPLDETVIDNFNRADGPVYSGAGGSIWETFGGTVSGVQPVATVTGNRMAGNGAYADSKFELQTSFDLLVDIPVAPTSTFRVYFGISGIGSGGFTGWQLLMGPSPAGYWGLFYHPGGAPATVIETRAASLAAGSTVWIAKRGTVITVAYRGTSGANYVTVFSVDDARGNVDGPIIVNLSDATVRLDDMRGGPLVAGGPGSNPLAGAVSVAVSDTGTLTVDKPLAGDVNVTASVTATLTNTPPALPLAGAVNVAVSDTGTLTSRATLTGAAINVAVTDIGTLTSRAGLVSAGTNVATVASSPAVSVAARFVAAVNVAVSDTGTLTSGAALAGAVNVAVSVTGTAVAAIPVSGAVNVTTTTAAASLSVTAPLAGAGVNVTTAVTTGSLLVTKPLASAVNVAVSSTGTLTNTPPGGAPVAGDVVLTTSVTGSLSVTAPLAGAGVTVAVSDTGTLTGRAALITAVSVAVSDTGTITSSAPLAGAVNVASSVTGSLTNTPPGGTAVAGFVLVAVSATGTAIKQNPLTAAANVDTAVTGTASSLRPLTAAVNVGTAGTGTLTVTTPLASAGVTVAVSDTGTLTGRATLAGAAAVAASVTGTLTNTPAGGAPVAGDVTVAVSVTGTAVKQNPLTAAVNVDAAGAGTPTILRPLTAASSVAVSVTGTLTNLPPGANALTGAANVDTSATGSLLVTKPLAGQVTVAVTLTGAGGSLRALAGQPLVGTLVTGAVSARAVLAADVNVTVTTAGQLLVIKPLSGAVLTAVTVGTATLTNTGPIVSVSILEAASYAAVGEDAGAGSVLTVGNTSTVVERAMGASVPSSGGSVALIE